MWDSNYRGVWHLHEATGGPAVDSTNTSNGSPFGAVTAANGQVDGAQSFDGSSGFIATGNTTVYPQFTYSAWLNPLSTSLDLMEVISKRSYCANSTNDFPTALFLNTAGTMATVFVDSGNNYVADLSTTSEAFSNNQWHHITATYNGTTLAIYVDGVLSNSVNGAVSVSNNSQPWTFGRASENGGGCGADRSFYNGMMDEVRISNVARPAEWIMTEFNNQSSPATFYFISGASSP